MCENCGHNVATGLTECTYRDICYSSYETEYNLIWDTLIYSVNEAMDFTLSRYVCNQPEEILVEIKKEDDSDWKSIESSDWLTVTNTQGNI
jgi:hypothetical protein